MIDNDYYNQGNGGWNDTYDSSSGSPVRQHSRGQSTNSDICSEVQFETTEVNSGTL